MPQNWVTDNIPGTVEYLSGDPNAPGFDASHGSESNYHDHFAFKDEATTRRAMKLLQDRGIQVTEFGVKGGHSPNSHHYSNRAFDVPGAQWGGSGAIGKKEWSGSKLVRQILLTGLRDSSPGTKPPSATGAGTLATTSSPTTTESVDAPAPQGKPQGGKPFTPAPDPAWLQDLQQQVLGRTSHQTQYAPVDVGAIIGISTRGADTRGAGTRGAGTRGAGAMVSSGTPEPSPGPVSNPSVRGALDGTRVGSAQQLQIAYGDRAAQPPDPGRDGLMEANVGQLLSRLRGAGL